jgi:hypothetical protein
MKINEFMQSLIPDVEVTADTPMCSICNDTDPEGGTKHLVLQGGVNWLEFCESCGEPTGIANLNTGENRSLINIFNTHKTRPKAKIATLHYMH